MTALSLSRLRKGACSIRWQQPEERAVQISGTNGQETRRFFDKSISLGPVKYVPRPKSCREIFAALLKRAFRVRLRLEQKSHEKS